MLQKTTEYAICSHQKVNHKYGDSDYAYHLEMVFTVAQKFIYLIAEEDQENVYCGCWVHDIIEDARETYNDVLQNTNETIAELAFALTNEKGKSRSERANDVFIKLCDRIANITHSKSQGSGMYEKYKKENDNFIQKTYRPELEDMIKHIDALLEKE